VADGLQCTLNLLTQEYPGLQIAPKHKDAVFQSFGPGLTVATGTQRTVVDGQHRRAYDSKSDGLVRYAAI
jgi:hypothetical protein